MEPDATGAVLAIEPFQRRLIAHSSDNEFSVAACALFTDNDMVSVRNTLFDHGFAADFQRKVPVIVEPTKIKVLTRFFNRFNRSACGNNADHRDSWRTHELQCAVTFASPETSCFNQIVDVELGRVR